MMKEAITRRAFILGVGSILLSSCGDKEHPKQPEFNGVTPDTLKTQMILVENKLRKSEETRVAIYKTQLVLFGIFRTADRTQVCLKARLLKPEFGESSSIEIKSIHFQDQNHMTIGQLSYSHAPPNTDTFIGVNTNITSINAVLNPAEWGMTSRELQPIAFSPLQKDERNMTNADVVSLNNVLGSITFDGGVTMSIAEALVKEDSNKPIQHIATEEEKSQFVNLFHLYNYHQELLPAANTSAE